MISKSFITTAQTRSIRYRVVNPFTSGLVLMRKAFQKNSTRVSGFLLTVRRILASLRNSITYTRNFLSKMFIFASEPMEGIIIKKK